MVDRADACSRKELLQRAAVLGGGLGAAGLLAACGGGSGSSSSASAGGATSSASAFSTGGSSAASATSTAARSVPPANLKFWWWGQQNYGGQGAVMKALFRQYAEEHPGSSITDVLQGTDETIPSYQAAAKAKKGPDIGTLWYGAYQFPEVWKGNVASLSDLIPASETDHWLEKKFNSFGGKIWASGVSGDGAVMLYNKDHFRKAGLDPNAPPTTWTDLLQAIDKLKAAGFTPMSIGVKDGWFGVVFMNFVVPQQAGGSPAGLLKQACSGKVSWSDPRLANMWERLEELKGHGAFNRNATSISYFDGKQAFDAGQASMAFTGAVTFAIASVRKAGPDKVGILAAPDLEGMKGGFIPGMPLSQFVTPFSEHKETAADLLTWLHQPAAQKLMFEQSKGVMIPTDDRFDFGAVTEPWLKTVYDQVLAAMKRDIPYADGIVPYDILADGPMKAMTLTFSSGQNAEKSAKMCQDAAEKWQSLNPDQVKLYDQWAT